MNASNGKAIGRPIGYRHKSLWLAASLLLACSQMGVAADLSRETLPPNDGWAAFGDGTTGGSAAADEHVLTVSSRKALVDAFALGDVPKIIQIKGTVNLSADDDGNPLGEADYADPAFDWEAYLETYHPAVWNIQELVKGRPPELSGPLEDARARSADAQAAIVVVDVPSNTTLIGVDADAKIIGGNLVLGEEVSNIIIRNITFEDSFDYFPAWSPRDSFKISEEFEGCQETYQDESNGPQMCQGGRWNAEYDLITITGATNVWIDHCTFSDGDRPDNLFPPVFPAPNNAREQFVQHHDGLIDIINQANYITLSYNVFKNHDKAHVIGNSDKKTEDLGHLKVTLRHNLFDNVMQRTPRVRFGEVHVYNNYYRGQTDHADYPFRYAFGIGKEGRLIAEANAFEISGDVTPDGLLSHFRGEVAQIEGTWLNGEEVDVIAAFAEVEPEKALSTDTGWKPTFYATPPLPVSEVPDYVLANAGAGKL